jgi:hypothetical protein
MNDPPLADIHSFFLDPTSAKPTFPPFHDSLLSLLKTGMLSAQHEVPHQVSVRLQSIQALAVVDFLAA